MNRISRIGLASEGIEEMLIGVLDEVLDLFAADRAWFMNPCDPEGREWRVPIERTRPGWPGAFARGAGIPMTPELAVGLRELLGKSGVFQGGPGAESPVPETPAKMFTIRSQVTMVLRPKVGEPWLFGIHHCAAPHLHPAEELEVFAEIGHRITDALSTRMALQQLRESEERCAFALEGAGDGVWDWDIADRKVIFSRRWKEMTGYTDGEICDGDDVGKWESLVHPDDRARVQADLQACFDGRTKTFVNEHRIRCKDGTWQWRLARGMVVNRDSAGRPLRMIGTHADITARKQSELDAQAVRDELAGILDAVPDLLFELGLDGRIHNYRGARSDLLMASPDMFLGKLASDFLPPAAAAVCLLALKEANETGRSFGRAYELPIGAERKWFELSVSRKPGRPADDPRFVVVARDVTARRQLEENRLVMDKLESTGILAGGIAHDFNNLLASIVLNLSLAGAEGLSRAQLLQRLEETKQAALAGRGLTEQLITFAEGGMMDRKRGALGALLFDALNQAVAGSSVHAEITIAPDLSEAEVDAGQIRQVIRNLALNAREAMEAEGTIALRARNVTLADGQVANLPAGTYVRISVVDQGHGIPPDVLSRIFDPYFSTKRRGAQKGMGLGLTICHSILKRHDGAISVESEVGRGTTVHLFLPAAASVREPGVAASPRGGRILIMDDEDFVRLALGGVVQALGYEVVLAADGRAAVDLAAAAKREGQPFAIVILDLTVRGGMGGRETIEEIRKVDPDVRAVVMSGYSNDEVLRDYRRFGFQAALTKPFERGALKEVLAQLIPAPRPG